MILVLVFHRDTWNYITVQIICIKNLRLRIIITIYLEPYNYLKYFKLYNNVNYY